MKDQQIIIVTNPTDLANAIERVLSNKHAGKTEPEFQDKMTRAEAARFAGVSYLTFSKWVNRGLLQEHGFGKKKFFFREEVVSALKKQG